MSSRMTHRLVRESIAPAALAQPFLDELWAFATDFVSRSREAFEAALRKFEIISVWRDRESGRMLGFAANQAVDLVVDGQPVVVIYSGWAWLAREIRGLNLIQAEGLRCYLLVKLRHPLRPVFWVFGASTYKSYLLLPRNLRDYFPRREMPWPRFHLAIRDSLMATMADPHWDPIAGVVHRHGASRYREGVVKDDAAVLGDPDVAFYASANPGQDEGDTLLALVPLSAENWLAVVGSAVKRILRR